MNIVTIASLASVPVLIVGYLALLRWATRRGTIDLNWREGHDGQDDTPSQARMPRQPLS